MIDAIDERLPPLRDLLQGWLPQRDTSFGHLQRYLLNTCPAHVTGSGELGSWKDLVEQSGSRYVAELVRPRWKSVRECTSAKPSRAGRHHHV